MQEDLLTELLQKNGGKGQLLLLLWIDVSPGCWHMMIRASKCGVAPEKCGFPVGIKLIKAPKQKEQLAPESSSPYSTPQSAPKPAPLSAKKSSQAPKQVWLQSCAVAITALC